MNSKKSRAYFKCLKVIKSTTYNTCELWNWLFKLRNNNIITYEQFLILAEVYNEEIYIQRGAVCKAPYDPKRQVGEKEMRT
jgi:hypothetical protein